MQSLPYQFFNLDNPALPSANFPFMDLQNNVGLLTLPNGFPTFNLGIGNFDTPNFNGELIEPEPEVLPTIENETPDKTTFKFYDPLLCSTLGILCGDPALGLGQITGSTTEIFKKVSVMLFALAILIIGLYFLAKSTDTGSAALNVAANL